MTYFGNNKIKKSKIQQSFDKESIERDFINQIKNNLKKYDKINKIFKKDIPAALERIFPNNIWLRPDRNNLKSMLDIVKKSSNNIHS